MRLLLYLTLLDEATIIGLDDNKLVPRLNPTQGILNQQIEKGRRLNPKRSSKNSMLLQPVQTAKDAVGLLGWHRGSSYVVPYFFHDIWEP